MDQGWTSRAQTIDFIDEIDGGYHQKNERLAIDVRGGGATLLTTANTINELRSFLDGTNTLKNKAFFENDP